jgi:Flp pilus assembly pilin Flp
MKIIFWKTKLGNVGQTATEYMLIVSVIVLGLVAVASHFIPAFEEGITGLAENVSQWLVRNQQMSGP